jgi:hypothetical protein
MAVSSGSGSHQRKRQPPAEAAAIRGRTGSCQAAASPPSNHPPSHPATHLAVVAQHLVEERHRGLLPQLHPVLLQVRHVAALAAGSGGQAGSGGNCQEERDAGVPMCAAPGETQATPVRPGGTGTQLPISTRAADRDNAAGAGAHLGSRKITAEPLWPSRAVRPTRWTYLRRVGKRRQHHALSALQLSLSSSSSCPPCSLYQNRQQQQQPGTPARPALQLTLRPLPAGQTAQCQ